MENPKFVLIDKTDTEYYIKRIYISLIERLVSFEVARKMIVRTIIRMKLNKELFTKLTNIKIIKNAIEKGNIESGIVIQGKKILGKNQELITDNPMITRKISTMIIEELIKTDEKCIEFKRTDDKELPMHYVILSPFINEGFGVDLVIEKECTKEFIPKKGRKYINKPISKIEVSDNKIRFEFTKDDIIRKNGIYTLKENIVNKLSEIVKMRPELLNDIISTTKPSVREIINKIAKVLDKNNIRYWKYGNTITIYV